MNENNIQELVEDNQELITDERMTLHHEKQKETMENIWYEEKEKIQRNPSL